MTTSAMSRLHHLRKLAYAPLVAAVAAGALSTGAGTSTAADTDTPQSGNAYNWALFNRTGQSIYGYWNAEMPTGDKSRVEAPADRPWQPDVTSAKATQYQDAWSVTTWTGHICYNKHWWDYSYSGTGFGDGIYFGIGAPTFSLEVDSRGALFVYPFADDRFWRDALTRKSGDC
ncbi:hypothetical protein [Rhodococcus jostii]|uniref:hypothetical protein n=1 Tax=Rhodococcus jostii TaxID=132919 RepID=UPI003635C915